MAEKITTFAPGTARQLLRDVRDLTRRPQFGARLAPNRYATNPITTRWGRTTTTTEYPAYPTSGNVVAVEFGNYTASPLYPGAAATKSFAAMQSGDTAYAIVESGGVPAEGEVVRLVWRNGVWWIVQEQVDQLQIRNDSGATRSKGEVLEVTGVVSAPVSSTSEVLTGTLRANEAARGVVTEDIAYNAVGGFALSGLAYAIIDVLDADHTHCYAKSNDANPQSNFGGPWRIVSKPSGTGNAQPALLLLGDACYERKVKTDATLTAGSSALCSFYIDGVDVGSEYVHFNWMENGLPSIAANKEGVARWFDDEERWVMVASEC